MPTPLETTSSILSMVSTAQLPTETDDLTTAAGFATSFAFLTAAGHPDKFGAIAAQSPLLFGPARDMVVGAFAKLEQPTRLYFEWGNYDLFNPHENWDMRKTSRELYDELGQFENLQLSGGEVTDSSDWTSWRNRFDVILRTLTDANQ